MDILTLMARRHSFYEINNKLPIESKQVINIIKKCLELYPSSFNTQSARLMILFRKEHQNFWSLVEKDLLKTAPENKKEDIQKRISSFAQGYGTILFFDNKNIVKELAQKMPLYAENFDNWSNQSNAILQYMIWTAFADNDIGANLQHYNPLINKSVQQAFDLPKDWELVAQMPFGGIATIPQPHAFKNIDEKLIIKEN